MNVDKIFLYLLIIFLFQFALVNGRTKCVRAKGRVVCPTDPDRHFNIEVHLFDQDPLPWESDDLMGKAHTDELGNYTVEGCADDFGSWNYPDPYIKMMHRCPEPGPIFVVKLYDKMIVILVGHSISVIRRHHIIQIEDPKFLPEITQVKTTRIDYNCENC